VEVGGLNGREVARQIGLAGSAAVSRHLRTLEAELPRNLSLTRLFDKATCQLHRGYDIRPEYLGRASYAGNLINGLWFRCGVRFSRREIWLPTAIAAFLQVLCTVIILTKGKTDWAAQHL
jgi:hypothetical protein